MGDVVIDGEKRKSSFLLVVCFLDGIDIELIQPMNDKSIYYNFLNKYGENFYHI